jgi:hypothetical protein
MQIMSRPRKIDEELWEDADEALSADHVVERFYSQHERDDAEADRKSQGSLRPKKRAVPPSED